MQKCYQQWINILLILVLLFIALVVVFYMISLFQKKKHIDEISRKDSYIGTLNSKIKKATTDERLRNIKTDELLLCLACIGLDEKHIAAVTGASYHNVFIRSRKCLEILGGGENLQEAIIIAISKSDII